ncbi:hypothetical protein NDU88_004484 [Pleurodeles waltl]|uniref:Secreted protein n=1 Tax=Pleurodeles waltl TaxID=8319 RepID=A0AAV7WVY0_PLEWA|nr:hypothetical protein NDU88_004484 [Pleurodeles waltl]
MRPPFSLSRSLGTPELLGRALLLLWWPGASILLPAGPHSCRSRSLCRAIRQRPCRPMNLWPASFQFSLYGSHMPSASLWSGGREHSVSHGRAERPDVLCCSPLGGVAGPPSKMVPLMKADYGRR